MRCCGCALLCVAVRCCALLCAAVRCCALLCVAVRCCALLFVAVRCCELLCLAVVPTVVCCLAVVCVAFMCFSFVLCCSALVALCCCGCYFRFSCTIKTWLFYKCFGAERHAFSPLFFRYFLLVSLGDDSEAVGLRFNKFIPNTSAVSLFVQSRKSFGSTPSLVLCQNSWMGGSD